jgi:hypothetical protein
MTKIVSINYQGFANRFTDDGWFNATIAAEKFGKRPVDWLVLPTTKEYIAALLEDFKSEKISLLVKTKRSLHGGTWLHPKLAVRFAQWLDIRFAIWCDNQIDSIIRGSIPYFDKIRLRHEAASSFKVMNAVLLTCREEQGKSTEAHHYINEARLINHVLIGEFRRIDRDSLQENELYLLAKLEVKNTVLIGRGLNYEERKKILEQYCSDFRSLQQQRIAV